MPIRVYEIAQELGVDSRTVLVRAKELGITTARVPSSSLDKITAEYLMEQLAYLRTSPLAHSDGAKPIGVTNTPAIEVEPLPPPAIALHVMPSITIRPGPSELYIRVNCAELFRKATAGDLDFCLEIGEAENSPAVRMRCIRDEFPRPAQSKGTVDLPGRSEIDESTKHLLRGAYSLCRAKSADAWVNLADFGNALKDAKPSFQPQSFGERNLGSLLRRLADIFEMRTDEHNPIVFYIREKVRLQPPAPISPISAPLMPPSPSTAAASPPLPKIARGRIHNVRMGFGFIKPDDGSENLFFHATEVIASSIFDLQPGDAVEYEPGVNEKGPCARNVRRMS